MRIARFTITLALALSVATPAHAATFSKAMTRRVIRDAAKHYHLSAAETRWLQAAAIDIIYTGAHESSGSEHAGLRKPRAACKGIVQFGASWRFNRYERSLSHHSDPRLSGRASLYRMARVMRDGGRQAIKRHWRATYGR